MKKIKSFFSTMFGKNKNISQKPLTKLSIFFVIIFDIFLFNNLYDGYTYQANSIKSPYSLYKCESVFFDKNISSYTIQEFFNFGKYSNQDGSVKTCQELKKLFTVERQKVIESYHNAISEINKDISSTQSKIRSYEYQYEKYLRESSSGINNANDRLSEIKGGNAREKFLDLQNELQSFETQKNNLISDFSQDSTLAEIFTFIDTNKDDFFQEYKKAQFWYPVKIALFQAILLIPIFLVSLGLYKIFVRKENKILSILFSNLTFIAAIFVLILLFKFLYFILPVKFFGNFIDILKDLNLGFLWNYILVFLGIALFGAIIYFSQKGSEKLKKIREENEKRKLAENRTKISKQRYFNNQCIDCGKTLLKDSHYCSHCGFDQYYECNNCHHKNPKAFEFCNKCGSKK